MQVAEHPLAAKFPSFKPSTSWLALLYGKAVAALSALAHGQPAKHNHPALNDLEVTLVADGTVEFGNPTWKVKLSPQNFSLTAPKLFKNDGVQLLRAEDGETGLSFDKTSSRHFFLFGKQPPSKIVLQLDVRESLNIYLLHSLLFLVSKLMALQNWNSTASWDMLRSPMKTTSFYSFTQLQLHSCQITKPLHSH
jgi:hypothetical protein